jgi:hypothetical protein
MMCDIFGIAETENFISVLRNCALNGCYFLCIAQLVTLSPVSCSFCLTQCFLLQGHRFAVNEPAHPWFLVRTQRDIPAASKSGSGAVSFAASSSSSGSTSGSGTATGYNSFSGRSGSLDGAPGGLIAWIVCPRHCDCSHHILYHLMECTLVLLENCSNDHENFRLRACFQSKSSSERLQSPATGLDSEPNTSGVYSFRSYAVFT